MPSRTRRNDGTVRFRPSRTHVASQVCASGPPRAHPAPIPHTADVTRRPAARPSHALRGTPNWDPVALYACCLCRRVILIPPRTSPLSAEKYTRTLPLSGQWIAFVGTAHGPGQHGTEALSSLCFSKLLPAAHPHQVFINAAPNVQPEPTVS
ncbi:hypothetical protein B0H14DRAFT_3506682 [Mycena olivaceomarginata]|nr:hypothetical protein B0H14DRAFT_3506682 [Mycena olivaceomarginata]